MQIVLASSSIYRKRLLQQLGLCFVQKSPNIEEELVQQDKSLQPSEVAQILAKEKALRVQKACPEAIIIASDQVASIENRILTKPGNLEAAKKQLGSLSGRAHMLYTAVYVCAPGKDFCHMDCTKLSMRDLSSHDIDTYLEFTQSYDTAGSYKIEQGGIALFEKIESEDFTAIQGLPMLWLSKCLLGLGFSFFEKT